MSAIFSRQCEYALQAVVYLALKPPGEVTSVKESAKRLDIPYHFLGKIFQALTRKGLLKSLRGPTGGFALAVPAKEITLYRIVEAIDGAEFSRACLLGFKECSDKSPCAVHTTWRDLRDDIHTMLADKNIAQLAAEMNKPGYRSR